MPSSYLLYHIPAEVTPYSKNTNKTKNEIRWSTVQRLIMMNDNLPHSCLCSNVIFYSRTTYKQRVHDEGSV